MTFEKALDLITQEKVVLSKSGEPQTNLSINLIEGMQERFNLQLIDNPQHKFSLQIDHSAKKR